MANHPIYDFVVRGACIMVDGRLEPRELAVTSGKVAAIVPLGAGLESRRLLELADDEVLIPGLVDTHVHVNEPGRTAWEGFSTATRAAAAGGVTTLIDMPLNSIPPTTDLEGLGRKMEAARGKTYVDVGFWGGAVPGNGKDLGPLHRAGVFGFKCFLADSGVPEFPPLDDHELRTALELTAKLGSILIVHAEDGAVIGGAPSQSGSGYPDFLASRPRSAENDAIRKLLRLVAETGARAHILHLSSAEALPMIAAAKARGLGLSAETCPHYLTIAAEDIPDGATLYKCCPPIREQSNRDALWEGLRDGTIDCIVTDHSPATPDLKLLDSGDFRSAWGGISSLQLGLSLVWTEARKRGVELSQVVEWMSGAPARIAGIPGKGPLAVGFDADLAIFAPDEVRVVEANALYHRHPITPYEGRTLMGVVRRTFVRGMEVDFRDPRGKLLASEAGAGVVTLAN